MQGARERKKCRESEKGKSVGSRRKVEKGCCKVGEISPFLVRGNVPRQMANNRSQETLPARRDHHTGTRVCTVQLSELKQ